MKFRFDCTRCGNCCRRPGQIALDDHEVRQIADYLELTPYELSMTYGLELDGDGGWLMEVEDGEACVFLVDDRCSVQPVKPVQCRTYPFWHEIVLEPGAWEEEAERCPGIGLGRSYTAAEIEGMLNDGEPTD